MTKLNASLNNLSDRLIVEHCELLDCGNIDKPLKNKYFDVIVSNPPYLKSKDLATLQPEIRYNLYLVFSNSI